MYSGLTAFVIGVNPLTTPHAVEAVGHSGNTIGMIGMAGLFVHVTSMGYHLVTEPGYRDDGMIRY
ncbi:MAG: hypothetical protein V5A27_04030 [Halapricum sp.]